MITKEVFLKDVENHQLTILADTDFVRSIRFKQPDTTNRYFDITTWDGHLCISGDMGTYVFKRLPENQEQFRHAIQNPSTLSGKLESVSLIGGYRKFDTALVEQSIDNRVEELCGSIPQFFSQLDEDGLDEHSTEEALEAAFREEVKDHFMNEDLGEYRFISAIESFESSVIKDLTLVNDDDYDWLTSDKISEQYAWVCHAIPWGIVQYDKFKSENENKDAE